MIDIRSKLPDSAAILPVYSVVAVPIFGWTFTSWLWKLPSWLNFLTAVELMGIFSYAMLTALVESLLIFGLLLLLCLILPSKSFRDQFAVRGTWLALSLAVCVLGNGAWRGLMRFTYADIPLSLWSLVGLLIIIVLTLSASKIQFMTRAALWISDRLTVFLFILIPISILSLVVVIARNTIPG